MPANATRSFLNFLGGGTANAGGARPPGVPDLPSMTPSSAGDDLPPSLAPGGAFGGLLSPRGGFAPGAGALFSGAGGLAGGIGSLFGGFGGFAGGGNPFANPMSGGTNPYVAGGDEGPINAFTARWYGSNDE